MPNISAHMIVAVEVGKRLNINSDEFIRGNLLPDITSIEDSHHKISRGVYLVPDISFFIDNLDLNNDLYVGYLTHLLLDKHYLEDYLSVLYPDENIFSDKLIYNDYDYLNYQLVKYFHLDVNSISKILTEFNGDVLIDKLESNIKFLKQKQSGETKYLDFESFSKFLSDISLVICQELRDYLGR